MRSYIGETGVMANNLKQRVVLSYLERESVLGPRSVLPFEIIKKGPGFILRANPVLEEKARETLKNLVSFDYKTDNFTKLKILGQGSEGHDSNPSILVESEFGGKALLGKVDSGTFPFMDNLSGRYLKMKPGSVYSFIYLVEGEKGPVLMPYEQVGTVRDPIERSEIVKEKSDPGDSLKKLNIDDINIDDINIDDLLAKRAPSAPARMLSRKS